MASIKVPTRVPTAQQDSEQLRKAMEGWGTNEDSIISILAHRNADQRKLIRDAYAAKYGEDLLKSLEKDLTSDFEGAVLLWTLDPAERDALLVNQATSNKSPSSNLVIMEVACTRSAVDLFKAKQAYQARFKRSIEEDVAHHTSEDYRKVEDRTTNDQFSNSLGYEGSEVNSRLAKSECKLLHEKISHKAYNHEEIIRILSTRSIAQLNATFNQYHNEFGKAINKDLKHDPKNEYLKLLRATIKCLTFPEKHFEKLLRLSMQKMGTDESALTRVVTTRAEVDMERIKEQYQKRNSAPLDRAIEKDTSQDYKEMLLALIGHGEK